MTRWAYNDLMCSGHDTLEINIENGFIPPFFLSYITHFSVIFCEACRRCATTVELRSTQDT